MNWFTKFMAGRYGGDQLLIFLVALSILLTLVGRFVGISILVTIGYIPFFVAIYRMLSKDVQKRSMENYKFAILVSPIYSRVKKMQKRIRGSKTHKYFNCPKCKTKLRVPKGRGKILVTCPKCKAKINKKS